MANVYTRRNKYPRTVTLRDFSSLYLDNFAKPRSSRCLSPTRKQNPHPTGLVYQDPYNKDGTWFDIWNPDPTKRSGNMPNMMPHMQRTNFSCGPVLPPVDIAHRGPPVVKYSLDSTYRTYFNNQRPVTGFLHHYTDVTRFSHTPRRVATGIVPNSLPPVKGATAPSPTPVETEQPAEA